MAGICTSTHTDAAICRGRHGQTIKGDHIGQCTPLEHSKLTASKTLGMRFARLAGSRPKSPKKAGILFMIDRSRILWVDFFLAVVLHGTRVFSVGLI